MAGYYSPANEKLTGLFVRLAFAGHRDIPRDGEIDLLIEAGNVSAPRPVKKPEQIGT